MSSFTVIEKKTNLTLIIIASRNFLFI